MSHPTTNYSATAATDAPRDVLGLTAEEETGAPVGFVGAVRDTDA